MRLTNLFLLLALMTACSNKSAVEAAAPTISFGTITFKEEVNLEQMRKEKKTRTSVYGSVSSGGGVSIGIGFLVGMFGSSDEDEVNPLRYEVTRADGSNLTIFHDSRNFEVGDCVKITQLENQDDKPPAMERSKEGC